MSTGSGKVVILSVYIGYQHVKPTLIVIMYSFSIQWKDFFFLIIVTVKQNAVIVEVRAWVEGRVPKLVWPKHKLVCYWCGQ